MSGKTLRNKSLWKKLSRQDFPQKDLKDSKFYIFTINNLLSKAELQIRMKQCTEIHLWPQIEIFGATFETFN